MVVRTLQLATTMHRLPMLVRALMPRKPAPLVRAQPTAPALLWTMIPTTMVFAMQTKSQGVKTCQPVTTMLQLRMTTAAAFMRRVAKRAQAKQMVRVPSWITIPMTTVCAMQMRSLVAKTR